MSDFDTLKNSWPEILDKIKQDHELTQVSFDSWLKPIEIKSVENNEAVLVVPSGDMGIKVLDKKYTLYIKVAIAEVTGLSLNICYTTPDSTEVISNKKTKLDEAVYKANINPKYTFDTFVVGSNNKFANAAALAVAESPGEIYNPLYLYSGVGLGKTHLMHAIANFILQNDPNTRVLYVTSEDFTNEVINAIRNSNSSMLSFKEKYRNIDVLLIDDIQFIMGKDATQEEFFHTFNALYSAKKQIIVSSDKPPRELNILEDRIRSRLEMGLIADISLPDYETRMAILRKKEETEGFIIDDEVMDYIASNVRSNIRELEGCLNTVRAKSVIEKKYVSLDYAEDILKDFISPKREKIITSDMIVDVVAEHYNITIEEIKSSMRNSKYVYPRKIAMYLCRDMTADSLQSIAKLLGKKDHTTVISACTNVEKDMKNSEEIRRDIEILKKKLNSRF